MLTRYRSLLFAPGNQARMIEKTPGLPADAILLDLEDAVPATDRPRARDSIRDAVGRLSWPQDLYVRVNSGPDGILDLQAVASLGVGIVLPKVEDVSAIHTARVVSEAFGGSGDPNIIVTIETSRGVANLDSMIREWGRVVGMIYGPHDFAASIVSRAAGGYGQLSMGRLSVPVLGAAFGVQAWDGASMKIHDDAGLTGEVQQAAALGYVGKVCIHPAQLAVVNAGFGGSEEDLDWARTVIAEYEKALAAGRGAIQLDGELIDQAHYLLATRMLERAHP